MCIERARKLTHEAMRAMHDYTPLARAAYAAGLLSGLAFPGFITTHEQETVYREVCATLSLEASYDER